MRGGFGILVGPGQIEDQIQPIESDRISTTSRAGRIRSTRRRCARTSPTTRTTAPTSRAPTANEYSIPERVYQYSASVQRELPGNLVATAAYVGSQGRNLFLRSFANRIIGRAHEREPGRERHRDPRVLDRGRARLGAQPVRGGRLQDQRRPRQLQRAAALAGAAPQPRA